MALGKLVRFWMESLRFKDGSTLKEIPHGKGRIFWAAYPVELAEGAVAAADLYAYVAHRLGIEPRFELEATPSASVLVYPVVLQDSVLDIMVSDSADDAQIELCDKPTGVQWNLRLPAQHAALALIGNKEEDVVSSES